MNIRRVFYSVLSLFPLALSGPAAADPGKSSSPGAVSVTVVPFEALGEVKKSVAQVVSSELESQVSVAVQKTVSTGSLNADAFIQSCGEEVCEKKTTHRVRGSIGNLGTKYIVRARLEMTDGSRLLYDGKREIPQNDDDLGTAVSDLARDIVECLQGKNCKDEPWGTDGQMPMVAGGGARTKAGPVAPSDSTGSGTLRVNTRPAGAEVLVDGDPKGKSPITIPNVEAGDHTVTLSLKGYSAINKVVTVENGRAVDVAEAFAELSGGLEVNTQPDGAQVYVDGEFKGPTPYRQPLLKSGSHTVKVMLKNYQDEEKQIEVAANRTERVDLILKGLPGKLVVTSTPDGAAVYVDGSEKGKTLWTGPAEAGMRKVAVKLPGFKNGEKEILVRPGQSAAVDFQLEEGKSAEGDMIEIPPGNFLYGDDKKQVSLPAFKIDKTEVRVAAYAKCVQSGKCSSPGTGQYCNWGKSDQNDHPINCVNWNDAKAYCEWAAKRLPTEQEWEKAARGTDGRTYPWGEQEPTCDRVIMDLDTDFGNENEGCGKNGTWPVCSKTAGNSPYGLCDMAGNVWEWTADWYTVNSTRVLRGGSWNFVDSSPFRAAGRLDDNPAGRFSGFGFRCAQ